jgi:hypothetical protein
MVGFCEHANMIAVVQWLHSWSIWLSPDDGHAETVIGITEYLFKIN